MNNNIPRFVITYGICHPDEFYIMLDGSFPNEVTDEITCRVETLIKDGVVESEINQCVGEVLQEMVASRGLRRCYFTNSWELGKI